MLFECEARGVDCRGFASGLVVESAEFIFGVTDYNLEITAERMTER
jgi:hypothetical protein